MRIREVRSDAASYAATVAGIFLHPTVLLLPRSRLDIGRKRSYVDDNIPIPKIGEPKNPCTTGILTEQIFPQYHKTIRPILI
jgi:hypothetical protein